MIFKHSTLNLICRWLAMIPALVAANNAGATLEDEIRAFEAGDAVQPPPPAALLFTGSSSIRGWSSLETAFPHHRVLNRGFGGSQMSDLLFYFDRVVVPYRPALVVVYEGDNDLAAGESVDLVFAEYTQFLDRIEQQLPGTDVALMAVKPSPSRAQIMAKMRELNDRLQARADGRHIRFIDVYTPLLNHAGQPRPELFQADMLHLNSAGYAVWQAVVGPALDAWALGRGQTFLLDFGAAGTPTAHAASPHDPVNFWNNLNDIGLLTAGQLSNLVTAVNLPTAISLAVLDRFNGVNENGTTASSLYPLNATRDSWFGNTEVFGGLSNVFPRFKLTGLDQALAYRFTFFASRAGVGDNRECGYTVRGANTGFAALDAANNVSNTASVANIIPDANAEITISLAPTTNNNNANHFTYLGALQIEAVPPQTPILFTREPASQSILAYQPVTWSAAVSGSGPYQVQWWSNGVPIPNANQFVYTISAVTPAMDRSVYSISVSNLAYGTLSSAALLTVLPDTNPPALLSASSLTGTTIELSFSKPLGPSAIAVANYRVNGLPISSAVLLPNGKSVLLTMAMPVAGAFTVAVDHLQDLAGNSIAPGATVTGTVPPPQPDTFLIDFGSSATTENGAAPDDPVNYWNNVTELVGTSPTGRLANLISSKNAPSPIGLVMVRRFNGANLNGTTAGTVFPADTTRDSLYGNTEAFNGLANVFPSFKLIGLNPGLLYHLEFYASRTGVSDVRETGYTVTGASTHLVALDAANNVTNLALVLSVAPSVAGEITVSLAPTARNNNANHFTYLGALRLAATVPRRFLPPILTEGRIRLEWTGDSRLESAPNLSGPWNPIVPAASPYLAPVVPGESRFFRLSPQ